MNQQNAKILKTVPNKDVDMLENMFKSVEKPDTRTRAERLGMFFIRRLLLCFNPIAPFNWIIVGILAIVYHVDYKKQREKGELTSAQMWSKLIGTYLLVTIPIFTMACSLLTKVNIPIIGQMIVGTACGESLRPDEVLLTLVMYGAAYSMVKFA